MTVKLQKGRYISSIFYFEFSGGNWIATLWRDLPAGRWTVQYRFRYYHDHKAFKSADEKHGFTATLPADIESEREANDLIDAFASLVVKKDVGGRLQKYNIRTDEPLEIVAILEKLPFTHVEIPYVGKA